MRTTAFARTLQRVLYTRPVASHSGFFLARSQPCWQSANRLSISSLICPQRNLFARIQTRNLSTDDQPAQRPLTDRNQADEAEKDKTDAEIIAARKAAAPAYQLWITCKKCLDRSSHTISKQAYHFGTCVVQCPKCKSQHLISDNLKIFSDTNITMEDIAKEHGRQLRKGRLGADGDIEFYDDDAETKVS